MKSRVHPKYKTKYHVGNWPAYDRALVQRGDITVWLAPDAIAAWEAVGVGTRGGQRQYSDLAIETALTLRLIFQAISEFPKWRKYLILLSFLDNSSARPVQIGGVDVNICHSRVDRSPRTPAVQFAIPSAGAILSHTDGPCGS